MQIEFEFNIQGGSSLHGDGMAMWLTRQRAQSGAVFGSADEFEGLGIFFDTYKNNRPGTVFPYVMAMIGDGRTQYDKDSDGRANEYAGCSARGLHGGDSSKKARVTYFQDKSLKLELQLKEGEEWTLCFEKEDPPVLPSVAYLGFSAETGELTERHELIGATTKSLYFAPGESRPGTAASRKRKPVVSAGQQKGGWGWWFFKFFLGVGGIGGAALGYREYQARQKNHWS